MRRPTSKNLWSVRMQHFSYESLLIVASTLENAAKKAITFCKRTDGIKRPKVTSVKFSGEIDAF